MGGGKRMGGRAAARVSAGVTVQALVLGALLVGSATPAFAARPAHNGGGGGGGGGTTTGFDVSYPQCGATLPTSTAFGIVGVNHGRASDFNPCFAPSLSYPAYTQSELYWAVSTATGTANLTSKALLYVNTADPGNVYNGQVIGDWPTSSGQISDPYSACTSTSITVSGVSYNVGLNNNACAWQYGYNMAQADAASLTSAATAIANQESTVHVPATPSSYPWWLDVETANTWQADTSMNVADLQGMIAGLEAAGVSYSYLGVYSTSSQWNSITGGTTSASGSLYGLANWIPGARTLRGAESNCKLPSFTGGPVAITQWTGTIDNDYAC